MQDLGALQSWLMLHAEGESINLRCIIQATDLGCIPAQLCYGVITAGLHETCKILQKLCTV